jgi:molybdopterin/thiamine biosynthesis adenylyltransferase
MLWIAILMLAVWFGGRRLGLPQGVRLALVGLIWLGVLGLLWSRPGALGGTATEWVVVGALGGAAWVYARGLGWLRARARPVAAAAPGAFSDAELERYSRHILLREIGGPGQKRLKAAKVLVVGAGGLGAPVLQYLGAAGVGTIGVIDDDVVDASNLHRQVIHTDAALGLPKVQSAARAIAAQNPFVSVRPYQRRLDAAIVDDLMAAYDLVIDGTDNFDTRYLVNRACARLGKPLLSGALTQWEGQLSLWDPARDAPCYECVFPERPAEGLVPACSVAGVAGPLPGVIGSMMALEAVKEIVGAGDSLRGKLVIYDALGSEWRSIRLHRRAGCAACGATAAGA